MDIGVADEIVEVVFIAVTPQQRSSVTAAPPTIGALGGGERIAGNSSSGP
jgi:hypothetical protein